MASRLEGRAYALEAEGAFDKAAEFRQKAAEHRAIAENLKKKYARSKCQKRSKR